MTDPLTGVANRRGFFETATRLLVRARFARQPTALIMFDLDRFKSINDKYGHQTGDEVLIVFCRLATSLMRSNDLFGRVGYATVDAKGSVGPISAGIDDDGIAFGGGAQFNLTDKFGVRAEYTRLEGNDDSANSWGLSGVM